MRFLAVGRRMAEDGVIAVWMQATDDGGTRWAVDAEALEADGVAGKASV